MVMKAVKLGLEETLLYRTTYRMWQYLEPRGGGANLLTINSWLVSWHRWSFRYLCLDFAPSDSVPLYVSLHITCTLAHNSYSYHDSLVASPRSRRCKYY